MSYDFSGNLVRMAGDEEGGTDVFLYDKVGRLATAKLRMPGELGHFLFSDGFDSGDDARWRLPVPDWSADLHIQTFAFDRFGNLTNVQTVTAQGSSNEPLASSESTNRLTGAGTCYDARGNVSRTGGVDCSATVTGTNYSFDPLNRQWKRSDPDGTSEYYMYSADDERILAYSRLLGPAFRWTLRDLGGKVLRRLESTSSPEPQYLPVRDYIFAGDRVAGTEDPRNPDTSRMHATLDHLGTPRLWTDDSGGVLRKLKYYPFGKQATPTDQWNVALQFTGHERDNHDLSNATDDGDYMHARHTSSLTGRFVSVDPAIDMGAAKPLPQFWNRYAYSLGNPLKFVDPLGLRVEFASDVERALAAAMARGNTEFRRHLERLENAKEIFRIQFGMPEGKDAEGEFTYSGSNSTFNITLNPEGRSYSLEQSLAHETRHALDYLDGRIGFTKQGEKWMPWLMDLGDEVRGFEAMLSVSSLMQKSGAIRGQRGDMSKFQRAGPELPRVVSRIGTYSGLQLEEINAQSAHYLLSPTQYMVHRP